MSEFICEQCEEEAHEDVGLFDFENRELCFFCWMRTDDNGVRERLELLHHHEIRNAQRRRRLKAQSETQREIERARRDRDELYMPFLKWIDDTFDTSQPWGGYAWGATGEDARVVPRYATNEDFRVTWEADVVLVGWYSTEVDDNDVIGLFEFKMTDIETVKEVILFVEGSDKPIKEALLDASKDERFSNSLEAFYE